jgi:Intron-binding protein aquarius N-terminus
VSEEDPLAEEPDFLVAVMAAAYESRVGQMETVNALPLYPTETTLWDENVIPSVNYTGAYGPCSRGLLFLSPPLLRYGWCVCRTGRGGGRGGERVREREERERERGREEGERGRERWRECVKERED